jgi:hypothetical protein
MFTYIFSVWLLKEQANMTKNVAVAVSLIGVICIAYGSKETTEVKTRNRIIGNLICAFGAVLFGLYRVLYKLKACLPADASAEMNIVFANIVGTTIGLFTILVFWLPIPFLHWRGWETLQMPPAMAAFWIAIAIACSAGMKRNIIVLYKAVVLWLTGCYYLPNLVYTSSFLALIALTTPVLSSVAAL